ncbi:copper chaperone PCu(A)C [Achromobacter veterisilvae]|uniref:copper chaperone PCu(A)C n=1 Tax=Achromobacter veterisilvae TaxID=2069367 RepID=UPI00100F0A85|nr:copper chaperone PCu(A)C [Achromobacter veterisilvae]
MKRLIKLATAIALCASGAAFAHGYKAGPIEIDHPWSRATVPAVPTGVVYFVLRNPSQDEDRLVSVSTPVAEKAELHTHIRDSDVMRMRKVDSIEIAPVSTTALEPGGLHVMLIGLKQPLVKGKAFPLTLVFEEAGPVTVQVDVQGTTDKAPAHTGSGQDGHTH